MKVFTLTAALLASLVTAGIVPQDSPSMVVDVTDSDWSTLVERGPDDFVAKCDDHAIELQPAQCGKFNDGLKYLETVGMIKFNPRQRGRISCSWNAGIYIYNKLNVVYEVSGFQLANQIRAMEKACGRQNCLDGPKGYFRGKSEYDNHIIYLANAQTYGEKC